LQVILCVSNNSNEVCERIIQTGFHVDMLKNLSWDTLSVDSLNIAQSDVKICIVKWLIGTLHNVLRRAKTGCSALRQCQAVNVLQKFRDAENQVIFFIFLLHCSTLGIECCIICLPRRRLLLKDG